MRFVHAPAPAPFETLTSHHYRVIYIDPPWDFSSGKKGRHPGNHYDVMSLDAIKGLPIAALAHPEGARVLCWTTLPFLRITFDVFDAWGLRYSTGRVWIKTKAGELVTEDNLTTGTGLEVLGNAEIMLIGKIGRPRPIMGKKPHSVIVGERRGHSRKPDKLRDEIEQKYRGPMCELVARTTRPFWCALGNDVGKFEEGVD